MPRTGLFTNSLQGLNDLLEGSGAGSIYKKTLGKGFGRTAEDVADYVEGLGGENIFTQSLAKTASDIGPRAVQRAVEAPGAAIGAASTIFSPEMHQRVLSGEIELSDAAKAVGEAAKTGAEQSKDVIENVDVATLGAGLATKGLTTAAKTAKTGVDALKLVKRAKAANVADIGLSTGDALYGASTLKEAIDEDDIGKGAEGLARIFGGAAGGVFGKRSAKEIGNIEDVAKQYDAFEKAGMGDALTFVKDTNKKNELNLSEAEIDKLTNELTAFRERSTPELTKDPNKTFLGRYTEKPDMDSITRGLADPRIDQKPLAHIQTESGNRVLVLQPKNATPDAKSYIEDVLPKLTRGSEEKQTLEWIAETVDGMAEETVLDLAKYMGQDTEEALSNLGRLGMYELDTAKTRGAWTMTPEGRAAKPEARAVAWNNSYALNLPSTARMSRTAHEQIMNPMSLHFDDDVLATIPKHLHEYVQSRWEGGQKIDGFETQIKNALFMRQITYNILHEATGHALRNSQHKTKGMLQGMPSVLTPGREGRGFDTFDEMHNFIVENIMRSETVMKKLDEITADPSKLADDSRIGRLVDTLMPPKEEPIVHRTDRAMGPTRNTRIDYAAVDDIKAGAEEVGKNLEEFGPHPEGSAHWRIKKGLARQMRGDQNIREANVKEARNMQAQNIRRVEKGIEEGKYQTSREMEEAFDQARKVSADVVQAERGVALTEAEMKQVFEDINLKIDDAFDKTRLMSSIKKLHVGEILQPNEAKAVRQYLTGAAASEELSGVEKMWGMFRDAVGTSRAIMTSADVSAAGRQGLYASIGNPRMAADAFSQQLKSFIGTEAEFKTFMDQLTDSRYNPYTKLQDEAGLHISHEYKPGGDPLKQEEVFSFSKYADKLPFNFVRRSERAYIAYLNKMRVGLFNKMADQMMKPKKLGGLGMDSVDDVQHFKDLAYMVNTLTGRGELSIGHLSPESFMARGMNKAGKFIGMDGKVISEEFTPGKEVADKAHELLTTGFFAPRFAASRAAILRDATTAFAGGNLSPVVYKEYMRNVMTTVGTMTAVMSGLAAMGVGKLTWDYKKSDFGVLKIGKTRYDPWGGMKQWVKLFTMLGSEDYYSSTNQYRRFGDYGARSKTDVLTRFMLTKSSPAVGLVMELMTGESPIGEERSKVKAAAERITPMVLQNLYEIYEEEGAAQTALSAPFVVVGGGTATYDPFKRN